MAKITVYPSLPANLDEEAVELLASEAGFEIGCEPVEGEAEAPSRKLEPEAEREAVALEPNPANENAIECEAEGEVLLVVLGDHCVEDPLLNQRVRSVVGSGGRVIGVWPHDAPGPRRLPPCFEALGSDAVVWNADALRLAISGEAPQWHEPGGERRPQPKTRRNVC
jgi:hypothetical protein